MNNFFIKFFKCFSISADNCWEWNKTTNPEGYGIFYGGKGRTRLAHRWLFESLNGHLDRKFPLDHLCRNRKCVNPKHLELVTHKENIKRGLTGQKRGLQQKLKASCPKGHEYSTENTNIYETKKGYINRRCKQCHAIKEKQRRKNRVLLPITKEALNGL